MTVRVRAHFLLIGCLEILLERGVLGTRLFQLVDRDRVRYSLDQSSIFACCDDIERLEP